MFFLKRVIEKRKISVFSPNEKKIFSLSFINYNFFLHTLKHWGQKFSIFFSFCATPEKKNVFFSHMKNKMFFFSVSNIEEFFSPMFEIKWIINEFFSQEEFFFYIFTFYFIFIFFYAASHLEIFFEFFNVFQFYTWEKNLRWNFFPHSVSKMGKLFAQI